MAPAPASPADESGPAELESEEAAPAEKPYVDGASPSSTNEDYAEVESKRGCGCRIVGQPASGELPLGLGLVGLWLVRRRRQHARVALRPDT